MNLFDQPAYLKKPGENEDVIIFGKDPAQEADDLAKGIARFGGTWRTPSYMNAYVRSASMLVATAATTRELDDVGLPIFYLQRHATELCIKRLLSWLYEIAEYRKAAGKPFDGIPTQGQRTRFSRSHGLAALMRDLTEVAEQLQFDPPPQQLKALAMQLADFEKTATWARYESSEEGGEVVRHVEQEVALPVASLQERLEQVVQLTCLRAGGRGAYEQQLYDDWYGLARAAGDAD